jgi:hypothetical protein
MSTLGFLQTLNPPRHALNQILTHTCWNSIPYFLDPLSKLLDPLGWMLKLSKLGLDMNPEMFNRIDVRGLCRPAHDSVSMILEPLFGKFGGVLGVIVLLENNVLGSLVVIMQGLLELILQNGCVELGIHLALNPCSKASTLL